MEPIQEPITGVENQGDLKSPYQALVQFYCAFNRGDLSMMEANWANTDDIVNRGQVLYFDIFLTAVLIHNKFHS